MEKNVLNTDLSGKVAVVTGAGGVLCSGFAKVLARAGAKVALLNRTVEKAQKYAESAKKLYQNIHGETDRVIWMTNRHRDKLEKSKEEGDNFLKKAIAALNEYTE